MAASASAASANGAARAAAFFDLDRTLMAGSSGLPYARAACKAGWLDRRTMMRWALDHVRFRLRGASEEATARVLAEARDVLSGIELKQVTRMTPDVLVAILPRIYPQMLEEVHAHQDAGRATVIVSAAGQGIVETLGRGGWLGARGAPRRGRRRRGWCPRAPPQLPLGRFLHPPRLMRTPAN